jgi:hypothetical protein
MKFKQFLETPMLNTNIDDNQNYFKIMSDPNREYKYGIDRSTTQKIETIDFTDKTLSKFKIDVVYGIDHGTHIVGFFVRNTETTPKELVTVPSDASAEQKKRIFTHNNQIDNENSYNPDYYVGRLRTEVIYNSALMINDVSVRMPYRNLKLASNLYKTVIMTKCGLMSDSSLTKVDDKGEQKGSYYIWESLIKNPSFIVYAINEASFDKPTVDTLEYNQLCEALKQKEIEARSQNKEVKPIQIVTPENIKDFLDKTKKHVRFLAVKKTSTTHSLKTGVLAQ